MSHPPSTDAEDKRAADSGINGSADNGKSDDAANRPQPTRFAFARKKGAAVKVTRETGKRDGEEKEILLAIGENGMESTGGKSKEEKIIPKQENSWRPEKKMRSIYVPGHESPTRNEDRFVVERIEAGPEESVQYGLNVRAAKKREEEELETNGARERQLSFAELEVQKLRQDLEDLPEEADLDAYESMPIEDFGAAMLRGMGWEKGKAIGRNGKGPVEPVEYVPRVGRLGLGATPKPEQVKEKKFLKPGESREPKADMVAAVGSDGKVRHVKPVGEQLVERIKPGVHVGKVMRIIGGRHEGLKAEVVLVEKQTAGSGRSERATVKLLISDEKVSVRVKELVDIGSLEEERAMKLVEEEKGRKRRDKDEGTTERGEREGKHDHRGLREETQRDSREQREGQEQRERREGRSGREVRRGKESEDDEARHGDGGGGAEGERKQGRDGRRERGSRGDRDAARGRGGESSQAAGDRDYVRGREEDGRSSRGAHTAVAAASANGGTRKDASSNGKAPAGVRSWLRNQIRVRVVDKTVAGGRLYLKKGTVVDISAPTVCDVLVDETQKIVQLDQHMLETVVPKRGGRLAVVAGKYKGQVGKLLERHVDDGVTTVQLAESFELVTLGLDMVAEFVGEQMLEEG